MLVRSRLKLIIFDPEKRFISLRARYAFVAIWADRCRLRTRELHNISKDYII